MKEKRQNPLCDFSGYIRKDLRYSGTFTVFLHSEQKKFILSGIAIAVLFFILPMAYSSPEFVLQSYADWYHSLIDKNNENQVLGNRQDISLMGFFRRILGDASISNLIFLAVGLPLFALPYARIKQYKNYAFQLMILASTLLFFSIIQLRFRVSDLHYCCSGSDDLVFPAKSKNAIHYGITHFCHYFHLFFYFGSVPEMGKKRLYH